MIVQYNIPATRDQGSYTAVGTSSYMESASENALWDYNRCREHDGLRPLKHFPRGTTSKRLDEEEK